MPLKWMPDSDDISVSATGLVRVSPGSGGLDAMAVNQKVMFVGEDPDLWPDLMRTVPRERWRMTFAHSADEALAALDEESYDAMVTNLRLPGMDGADLLQEARSRRPEMLRFMRSEASDAALGDRWIGAAHQLLDRPSNAQVIESMTCV